MPAQFQDAALTGIAAMPSPDASKMPPQKPKDAVAQPKQAKAVNPFGGMNLSAKNFVPVTTINPGQESDTSNGAGGGANRIHADSVDPFDDFGGYQNPYSATIDVEKEKRKLQEKENEEESKKTYSIDFMMSFRTKCKTRPNNMALLVLPHKKRQVKLN